jgi:ATP-binding cassette subfamily B protein
MEGIRVQDASVQLSTAREFLRLFRVLATPYVQRQLSLSLLVAVVTSLLGSISPLLIKWMVDRFGTQPSASTAIMLLVVLYALSLWLNRVLGAVQGMFNSLADRRMYRALSDRLFDHVIRLPLRFHLERRTGAVSETLTNGLMGYQIVQQTVLVSVVPVVIQLATVTIVLVSLQQTTVLLLLMLAAVGYAGVYYHGVTRSNRNARDVSSGQIDARALMTDSILNYETVKYFTAEAIIRQRLDDALCRSERDWIKYYMSRSWNAVLIATVFAAFVGATMAYAVFQVSHGAMTVGTFVLVNAYMLQLVAPIEMIGGAAQTLSQGLAFVERMLELLRVPAEPPSDRIARPLPGPGKLQFENVSVGYRSDRPTLRKVSFVLPAGKTLGIVGASGAGKSTLVRLLTRLMEPDEGRILIDDVPVSASDVSSIRAAIAVVPQDTVLFNDTIAYNIGFGRAGSTQDEIEEAARLAELHDFIMRLPDGYQTNVGERGVRLSGGEKQRVSIARAALKRPRIFVFDEATSSLDSRTERGILVNIRSLAARTTTLVIAHRLSTVQHADQLLVLDGGLVVEQGTHESLLELNGRYSDLWRLQLTQSASDALGKRPVEV